MTHGFLLKTTYLCIEPSFETFTMIYSFSWQLPFLLFLSIPIAYADWNFDSQALDKHPSSPLPGFVTNNGLPEYSLLDLAISDERAEEISVTASDQSQRNTISNEVELISDSADGMIPEGPIMAEGEGCLPNNGRSSRKMRVRRDQGVCEWNVPQQLQNVPQTPETDQQKKPQGQITGGKKSPPGGGKKRKTSISIFRVTPDKQAEAEPWFPKADMPKSDKLRCRTPKFDIPVCAYFIDSIEMFPAIMGLGPVCVLVPATVCMFPLFGLQLSQCQIFSLLIYMYDKSLIICSALCRLAN